MEKDFFKSLKIKENEWFKYYNKFLDIKDFVIESEGNLNEEYDIVKFIIACFYDKKKSKEENLNFIKKITDLIFKIYEKYEKPEEEYLEEIRKIFPHSKEKQARLYFLIEQANNSHIPID